ncbi:MAG: IMP cyclohydrolase [Deltaproteobacteria bacterium]|nr:IMP cyclohydrolase [Deltaproteobacteria bacterium]
MNRIQRALISVTDKSGVVEFARELSRMGIEILSTGGTAKAIAEAGVPVVEVAEYTGFPEMLDGRVKTLHPKIHAGILFRRDVNDHVSQMADNHLPPIDLVCVNLYAFESTVAKSGVTLEEAVENIDIGGPTLLRAAAKNYGSVTVVVEPADYPGVIEEIKNNGQCTTLETRFNLAKKVFALTHHYDGAITRYLADTGLPS